MKIGHLSFPPCDSDQALVTVDLLIGSNDCDIGPVLRVSTAPIEQQAEN